MSADLIERTWFVFALTVNPVPGCIQPTLNHVPASSEKQARDRMRATVDPALHGRVETWPLVATRVCSREALSRSLLRAARDRMGGTP